MIEDRKLSKTSKQAVDVRFARTKGILARRSKKVYIPVIGDTRLNFCFSKFSLKLNGGMERRTIFVANKLIIHRALLIMNYPKYSYKVSCIAFKVFLKLNKNRKMYNIYDK